MNKSTYYLNMGKGKPVKVEGYIFKVDEYTFGVDKRADDPKYDEAPYVVTEINTGFSLGTQYAGNSVDEAVDKVTKGIKAIRERMNTVKGKTKFIDYVSEFKRQISESETKTSRRRLI